MTVDPAGLLHPLATPSLPDAYALAIDGVMLGPEVGSCGTAAYMRKTVGIADIAADPRCARYKPHALVDGLKARWSYLIISESGGPIGVLHLLLRETRGQRLAEMGDTNKALTTLGTAHPANTRVD